MICLNTSYTLMDLHLIPRAKESRLRALREQLPSRMLRLNTTTQGHLGPAEGSKITRTQSKHQDSAVGIVASINTVIPLLYLKIYPSPIPTHSQRAQLKAGQPHPGLDGVGLWCLDIHQRKLRQAEHAF